MAKNGVDVGLLGHVGGEGVNSVIIRVSGDVEGDVDVGGVDGG